MRAALFLAGLLLAGSAWANIGSVTESTGTAVIKRGKDIVAIAKGTVVEMNDRIETRNGRVKVIFKDATAVTVTESSTLVIDDFVYDPASGSGKLGLKAAAGTVRYVSGAIARDPKNVKINTPTAAITVRGTDFVMAVGETGASMIMLMPTCESEIVNLRGTSCSSGAIDVETPAGIVKLTRPYQATIVETASAAPLPPVTVNLAGMSIGTNLLINPPKTAGGASIVAAAKAAADRTGDSKQNDQDDKDDAKDDEKQQVASQQGDGQQRDNQSQETTTKVREIDTKNLDISVGDVGTPNPNVRRVWRDKSETQQVGWQYESLSSSGNNYANITFTMDTKVLVIVSQDRIVDAFNFNTQSSKSYGLIVINQTYR